MVTTLILILLWGVVLINLLITVRLVRRLQPLLETYETHKRSNTTLLSTGTPAPDFQAQLLEDGNVITLAHYNAHSLLMVFVSPFCRGCRAEIPIIVKLYPTVRRAGVEVVLICFDHRADVAAMVQELKIPIPVILADSKGSLTAQYNPQRLTPLYYFIEQGTIQAAGDIGDTQWVTLFQEWQKQAADRRANLKRFA